MMKKYYIIFNTSARGEKGNKYRAALSKNWEIDRRRCRVPTFHSEYEAELEQVVWCRSGAVLKQMKNCWM